MFSTRYNAAEKLWCGNDSPPLYNPNLNMAQALLHSMSIFGPKIAQVRKKLQFAFILNKISWQNIIFQINDDSGIQMTFDEIRIKTIRAAQNLRSRGYDSKQVFGIMARNSHHVAPILIASIANGCPINPLDPSFGKTEVIHMLTLLKPVLIFCDVACYDLLNECLTELGSEAKVFTFGGQKGESEAVENLFEAMHKEDDFT